MAGLDGYLAPIRRILKDLTGDAGEIQKISERWKKLAPTVASHTGALNRAVKTVDDAWNGQAAESFSTYMAKYPEGGAKLATALARSAGRIDAVGSALTEAKGQVQDLHDTLSAWLKQQEQKKGNLVASTLQREANKFTTQAKQHEQTVMDAIDQALTEINEHLGAKFFSGIPAPGDENFLPKNAKLGWTMDPKFKDAATTQPAADNSGKPQDGGSGEKPQDSGSGDKPQESGNGSNTPAANPALAKDAPKAEELTDNPEAQKVLDYALKQLGDPYVYGANSEEAFDCSSLAKQAYGAAGIDLPRVADDQWNAGPRVAGAPQAGDLVFFDWEGDGVVDHVGIVTDPEAQKMIHAPRTGEHVKIEEYGSRGGIVGYTRPGSTPVAQA